MLWWFLVLGISLAVVVLVALRIFVHVRSQMKGSTPHKAEDDGLDHSPPEA
jgi:hypothetical protein